MNDAFDPASTLMVLTGNQDVRAFDPPPDFWSRPGEFVGDGRLMLATRRTGDDAHWEMHPNGEEVVMLFSGAVDLIVEEDGGERVVKLRGRSAFVVPRGVWHRAVCVQAGEMLYITAGEGTQHRAV